MHNRVKNSSDEAGELPDWRKKLKQRRKTAETLQRRFDLPESLAKKCARRLNNPIDDFKRIKQDRQDNYVELIREYERLRAERQSITDEWLSNLREYADTHGEYHNKRTVVRDKMHKSDEWSDTQQRIEAVKSKLLDIYRGAVSIRVTDSSLKYKKDKIIELKHEFPYLRVRSQLIAELLDTTADYAGKFTYHEKETSRRTSNLKTESRIKKEVLKADDYSCVRCESESELETHHIIPHAQGGPDELSNMATLCKDCHTKAHAGQPPERVVYESRREFWKNWVNG